MRTVVSSSRPRPASSSAIAPDLAPQRARHVHARALGRRGRLAVAPAQADGGRQLVRDEVHLLARAGRALGVVERLGLLDLGPQVLQARAVLGLGLGVERRARVAGAGAHGQPVGALRGRRGAALGARWRRRRRGTRCPGWPAAARGGACPWRRARAARGPRSPGASTSPSRASTARGGPCGGLGGRPGRRPARQQRRGARQALVEARHADLLGAHRARAGAARARARRRRAGCGARACAPRRRR